MSFSDAYRYEQNAPNQSASQCRFDDLLVTITAGAMPPNQRRDVEGHLCDGTKRGVDYCPHCEVTLCRNAEQNTTAKLKHEFCVQHNGSS